MTNTLCLDDFEFRVVAVDRKPVSSEQLGDVKGIRVLSNGRLLLLKQDGWQTATRDEVVDLFGPMLRRYDCAR